MVLAVGNSWTIMPRRHLELTDLALGESAIVADARALLLRLGRGSLRVRVRLLLLLLLLLGLLSLVS
jgi:hypothetical protein